MGQSAAILRFVIHFGIRTFAEVDVILFGRYDRRETGEKEAAEQDGNKDSTFHIGLVNVGGGNGIAGVIVHYLQQKGSGKRKASAP
jgi:hypothetical protein